jgi:hypothetical protein
MVTAACVPDARACRRGTRTRDRVLGGVSVRTELLISALSWLMVLVLLGALIGQAIR